MNLQTRVSTDLGRRDDRSTYLTQVARDVSACKAFTMVSSFLKICPSEPLLLLTSGHSMRSHIHGSNRNRIALHVMLNNSRNRMRFRW